MVFNKKTILDLKLYASGVLEAIIYDRGSIAIQSAFEELIDKWDNPGMVLFRRSYHNATISMSEDEQSENWNRVLQYIDISKVNSRFIIYDDNENKLFLNMTGFYTSLSIIETAHMDQINAHYANR